MKKIGLISVLVAAALFTGCSQKSVTPAADTNKNTSSESSLNKMDQMADETVAQDMADITSEGKGNYFSVNGEKQYVQSIYFGFDKYNLTTEQRSIAKSNADKLVGYNGKIKVEGNCDEWGTDEYNYALGLKRAKVVKDALVADGIPAGKITLVSFGESNPVCSGKTQDCWQKNRRSEYKPLP
jgi:peptidoglycan-associated lipoprotein